MNKITEIADLCFRKGPISYKPTIRWYTNRLRVERSKVAASYKRYKNDPSNDNLREIYKKYRNSYNKNVKKAKKDSWLSFCNKTNEAYGDLYSYISSKKIHHTDLILLDWMVLQYLIHTMRLRMH